MCAQEVFDAACYCAYNFKINTTFDPAKNVKNIEKHGVSLADVAAFEWESAATWIDQRREYGEQRIVGLGYIGDRLFSVVFVDRGENRRIISLRKANKREESIYAQT